ncbi:3-deoxy-manno-octulosonate cytidylyltransferase family protein [Vibrio sonorensis]|uniref:3-deoxy-manno-octulosonate cytidylyltransferase family protein n=1 Tax=Vibrio sonorensis TaxID=1004316 RepID=UPI0008D9DF69|nr:manno-octulosonate cytidylyltransferase [Vibrio sonorensis]
MSEVLIVIPARYGSTRLPGKPLKAIAGIEMIKRVADIAANVCTYYRECNYVVATDDQRIQDFCSHHNIPSVMTSESCKSGTDRSWDAVQQLENKPKFVINLQGDNPLCPPWFITALIDEWKRTQIAGVYTAYVALNWQELDKLRETKSVTPHSGTTVQIDKQGYALTFSKAILPVIRKEDAMREQEALSPVKRHIGLYAYTYDALQDFFKWDSGIYEECEGLEQMRFLENGTPIKMVKVGYQGRIGMSGVDSPEDIERAETIIKQCGEFDFYAE